MAASLSLDAMADEANGVRARETVRIPANYCFQIDPPAGTERLFVVLSQKQEEIDALDKAVRGTKSNPTPAPQTESPTASIVAENRLDAEVQRMRAELGSQGYERSENRRTGSPGRAPRCGLHRECFQRFLGSTCIGNSDPA